MKNTLLKFYQFSMKITLIVLAKITGFLPKDAKKIIFVTDAIANTKLTSSNTYLISKYMEAHATDYKMINLKHNELYTIKNLFHILTAKALVIDTICHGLILPANLTVVVSAYFVPFKSDDVYIIVKEFLAKTFNTRPVFYLCSSAYEAHYVSKSYNIPKDGFRVMGSPRREWLIKNKIGIDVQHFFDIAFKPEKVILYAPTYRDKFVEPTIKGYQKLEKLSQLLGYPDIENDLEVFLVNNNAVMVINLHTYLDEGVVDRLQGKKLKNVYFLTEKMSAEKQVSIYDFFWSSDCLISDYSSISFDYLLTDKPIIYNVYDVEEYKQYRGIAHDPMDEIMAGDKVKTKAQFFQAIQNVLDDKDGYKDKRKEVLAFIDEVEDPTKIMDNITLHLKNVDLFHSNKAKAK